MKLTSLFSVITILIASTGFSAVSSKAQAATYFKCEAGYTFQVSGSAARCFKAATVQSRAPIACKNVTIPGINKSVGHFLKKDYQGNRDKCVGTFKVGPVTNTSVLDLACRHPYALRVRNGTDRCTKNLPAKALAPVKRVQR